MARSLASHGALRVVRTAFRPDRGFDQGRLCLDWPIRPSLPDEPSLLLADSGHEPAPLHFGGGFSRADQRLGPRLGSWLGVRVLVAACRPAPLSGCIPGEFYTWAWMILAWGIAIQAGKILQRHPACFQRIVLATLPVLTALVLVLTGWVMGRDWLKEAGESARPLPPPGSPNVLLIVLDTVRADRLSVYGYARKTTPTLERIASEGVRFDAARSTSSWTLPAHASMFTGRLPHELRAKWSGAGFPAIPHTSRLSGLSGLCNRRLRRQHAVLRLRHRIEPGLYPL